LLLCGLGSSPWSLQAGGAGAYGVDVEGVVLKCTVTSWPNVDWQPTADFLTTSALCLLGAGMLREIKI